jgi:hypothetical protein
MAGDQNLFSGLDVTILRRYRGPLAARGCVALVIALIEIVAECRFNIL